MPENAPELAYPGETWKHWQLHRDVREALQALPSSFASELNVSGVMATDIFTLNSAFGAMIEEQVVDSLNRARLAWDPDGTYSLYSFTRQAQRFPDVLLKKPGSDDDIVFGIELKGWYLLSKEGEPSFRFTTTPCACATADLVVVVPWVLSNIISGIPRVFSPYIVPARYAAEYRNYHWEHLRESEDEKEIVLASGATPYPKKADPTADVPSSDNGGNFGRFARTGLMDDYKKNLMDQLLRGIPARYWLAFFKAFQDQSSEEKVTKRLEGLVKQVRQSLESSDDSRLAAILRLIEDLKAVVLG